MPRLKLPVVAHVFLMRDYTALLARRANTGFEDGNYGPVGEHLEPGESVLEPTALQVIGVMHYTSPAGDGIDFFLRATRWLGEPTVTVE